MAMVADVEYRSPSVVDSFGQIYKAANNCSTHRIKLSLRDQQLLEAYVLGLSNREVAEQLNLSVRTVQTYSGNLLSRLGVNNRRKAIMAIARMGVTVVPRFFAN
jgi:DNA-binding NarL/FixJ family response regulator